MYMYINGFHGNYTFTFLALQKVESGKASQEKVSSDIHRHVTKQPSNIDNAVKNKRWKILL